PDGRGRPGDPGRRLPRPAVAGVRATGDLALGRALRLPGKRATGRLRRALDRRADAGRAGLKPGAACQRRPTTARVRRDTQTSRPASSSMRISQTWVLPPTCSARAVPVT